MRYLFISRSSKHQRILDQLDHVGRLLAGSPVAGDPQHAVGDLGRPVGRREDLLERLVPGGRILVPQAQLGVVENGHQHIVELVGGGAHQLAQGRQLLRLVELFLEDFDLLLETRMIAGSTHGHGLLPSSLPQTMLFLLACPESAS
jgi:hypothetical protein